MPQTEPSESPNGSMETEEVIKLVDNIYKVSVSVHRMLYLSVLFNVRSRRK